MKVNELYRAAVALNGGVWVGLYAVPGHGHRLKTNRVRQPQAKLSRHSNSSRWFDDLSRLLLSLSGVGTAEM